VQKLNRNIYKKIACTKFKSICLQKHFRCHLNGGKIETKSYQKDTAAGAAAAAAHFGLL
jgi:hypothetical protein